MGGADLRVQQARRPFGYGTDDNYLWATAGFSNVRELQLLRETGMHNLEVIKAATHNSALTLRQPKLGLVRPGYLADLLLVDGNPADNFRYMYSFGALPLDAKGTPYRTRGIVHTIKDGVVIENKRVMDEVGRAGGSCFEKRCCAKISASGKSFFVSSLASGRLLTVQPGGKAGCTRIVR